MKTTKTAEEQKQPAAQEQKQPTAKELTRRMIEAAKSKNKGKLGGGEYDRRKFRKL